jgi:hypothetical protein
VEVELGAVDTALTPVVAKTSVEVADSDAVAESTTMSKVATVCISDKLLASATDAADESDETEAECTPIMLTNEARSSLPMIAKAGGLSPVTSVGKATYRLVRLVVRW